MPRSIACACTRGTCGIGADVPTPVNRHHYSYVQGVGPGQASKSHKAKRELPQPWIYCGRGSPLGNPYTYGSYGELALPKYRAWLWDRLQRGDTRVWIALRSITGDTALVCSCVPKPCHVTIICDAWRWAEREGRL